MSSARRTASSQALTPLDLTSRMPTIVPSGDRRTSTSAAGLPGTSSVNTMFGFTRARIRPAQLSEGPDDLAAAPVDEGAPVPPAMRLLPLIAALLLSLPARAQQAVDLELVLAADGSGSIDEEEFRLQRQGFAAAIASPEVLDAIQSGMVGVNSVAISTPETPFGGIKESGYGSEGGIEGLSAYLNTKFVSQA